MLKGAATARPLGMATVKMTTYATRPPPGRRPPTARGVRRVRVRIHSVYSVVVIPGTGSAAGLPVCTQKVVRLPGRSRARRPGAISHQHHQKFASSILRAPARIRGRGAVGVAYLKLA